MIRYFILKPIRFYQIFISPYLGQHCRFYPSCSEYTLLAIKKDGVFQGCFKGIKRLFKCHPWCSGGVDLP